MSKLEREVVKSDLEELFGNLNRSVNDKFDDVHAYFASLKKDGLCTDNDYVIVLEDLDTILVYVKYREEDNWMQYSMKQEWIPDLPSKPKKKPKASDV